MKKVIALLLISVLMHLTGIAQQPLKSSQESDGPIGVVAHRGFHKFDDASENSIAAMQHAIDHDFFGTEFDVQYTFDSVAIVYHDAKMQGVPISQMTYSQVMKLPQAKLKGGETVPTLDQFLQACSIALAQQKVRHTNTRLFFEIKPPAKREFVDYVADESLKAIDKYGLRDVVAFISFDLDVCIAIAQREPAMPVAFLGGDISPIELYERGIRDIDYHYEKLLGNPQWVEEAHQLGMTVNAWTVNNPDIAQKLQELKVDFITTDIPLDLQSWH